MTYDSNKNKWERQPEESKASFKYFSFYLIEQVKNAKDPLQKTADYFNRTIKYMMNLSCVNKWKERAEAYNQYLAEEQQKEFEREYKNRCKETFIQIGAASQIIGQKLNSIVKELKDANGDTEKVKEVIGNLTLPQIVQVLKLNQDTMKMIMGIPDKQEVSMTGNVATTIKDEKAMLKEKLDKLSPEEREQYLELCEKADGIENVTDSE